MPRRSAACLVLSQSIGSVMGRRPPPGGRRPPVAGRPGTPVGAGRPAPRPSPSDVHKETELVQSGSHAVGGHAEQAGDGPYILGPDGDHPAVEVLAMHLDHAEELAEQIPLGPAHRVELGAVSYIHLR